MKNLYPLIAAMLALYFCQLAELPCPLIRAFFHLA